MNKLIRCTGLIAATLLLAGCSGESSDGDEKMPPTKASGVIPEYQQRALQQAEQVDDILNEAEQQRRDTIDKQY